MGFLHAYDDVVSEHPYYVGFWDLHGDTRDLAPNAPIAIITLDVRRVMSDTGRAAGPDVFKQTPSREQVQAAIKTLLPADAQLLNTTQVSGSQGTFIEDYKSDALIETYEPLLGVGSVWGDSTPGTIRVTYVQGGPLVDVQAGAASSLLRPLYKPVPQSTYTPWPKSVPDTLPEPVPSYVPTVIRN